MIFHYQQILNNDDNQYKIQKTHMDMELQLVFSGELFVLEKEEQFCHRLSGDFSQDCSLWDQQALDNVEEQEQDILKIITEEIKSQMNIRNTPLNQLLCYANQSFNLSQSSKLLLIKKLRKIKLLEKRINAKNRVSSKLFDSQENLESCRVHSKYGKAVVSLNADEQETKKQKNRLSAQISRDRKKQQNTQILMENKKLLHQNQNIQQENRLLKQQIAQSKSANHSKNSSLITLLILLGLLFLMRIIGRPVQRSQRYNKPCKDSTADTDIILSTSELSIINKQALNHGILIPGQYLTGDSRQQGGRQIPVQLLSRIMAVKQKYLF